MQNDDNQPNPPIFNVPGIIVFFASTLIAIHAIRSWLVPTAYQSDIMLLFAAIPARYGDLGSQLPYQFANWYTPLSHALLHADWTHLFMNVVWMLPFGAPVAKKLGTSRFIAFSVIGVLFGFLAHLITHPNDFSPMIGASGAVSAFLGGIIRLDPDSAKPIRPLFSRIQNRGILAFIAIWLGLNLIIGLFPGLIAQDGTQIAWQAHVGGFFSGLLLVKVMAPNDRNTTTLD